MVFRSNKHIYAQLISEDHGRILAAASSLKMETKGTKTIRATAVGKLIAHLAEAKKVKKVVFDRRNRQYHGRVKALAEAARQAGLEF
jgi:large subunit ribosomal protein L18